MKPLVVIPTFLREPGDVEVTLEAVRSVQKTEADNAEVLCVDDGSPAGDLVDELERHTSELPFEVHRKSMNEGFSKTVNVGLRRALNEGRDAVLMNADMEVTTPMWVSRFRATKDEQQQPAAVVGALLCYPTGLIQHAGIYFSLLTRTFDHYYKYGPMNLPEALKPRICPVTGAFQYIRHSTLEKVGLYDENFYMGWEDVDYCIRTFLSGEQCVFNPEVRGFHHEMMFRGRPSPKVADWQAKSWVYLAEKYAEQSFAGLVPFW